MKISTKIRINIATGQVIEDICFDYDGPVDLCKDGGETTVTNEVDEEYNARMADIAESQQAMADTYYEFWESDYKPYEAEQVAANRSLIPEQTEFAQAQIGAGMELLPQETALRGAEIDSRMTLLPGQTALAGKQIEAETALLPAKTDVQGAYYTAALEGPNKTTRQNEAQAGVEHGFKGAAGTLTRNLGRYGIDPTSGAAINAHGTMAIEKAKGIAGARNQAGNQVDDEKFRRLETATAIQGRNY
jgi:hypothetical protein